jgi:hypothetical protein
MVCGKPLAIAAVLLATGVLSAVAEDVCSEFARIEAIADEAAARRAVREVRSGNLLAHIARKSRSWRLRADAAYFISEEKVLREIFANDSSWHVKAAALFGMTDGTFLERVACNENEDNRIRAVAVNKLRDRTILERLKSSPNETVKRFALKQLPPEFKEAKVVPVPVATFTDVNSITRKTP